MLIVVTTVGAKRSHSTRVVPLVSSRHVMIIGTCIPAYVLEQVVCIQEGYVQCTWNTLQEVELQ